MKVIVIVALAALVAGCEGQSNRAPGKPAAAGASGFKGVPITVETFEERWKKADTDGDGRLSRAEAGLGYTPGIGRDFDAMDANKDGFVTRAEQVALRSLPASK